MKRNDILKLKENKRQFYNRYPDIRSDRAWQKDFWQINGNLQD